MPSACPALSDSTHPPAGQASDVSAFQPLCVACHQLKTNSNTSKQRELRAEGFRERAPQQPPTHASGATGAAAGAGQAGKRKAGDGGRVGPGGGAEPRSASPPAKKGRGSETFVAMEWESEWDDESEAGGASLGRRQRAIHPGDRRGVEWSWASLWRSRFPLSLGEPPVGEGRLMLYGFFPL